VTEGQSQIKRPNRKELICKRNYGVPLVSSFAQADALSKLLSERHHHATEIFREDSRRTSDVSGHVQADTTLMQMKLTRNSSLTPSTA